MLCPSCSRDNSDAASFCAYCGGAMRVSAQQERPGPVGGRGPSRSFPPGPVPRPSPPTDSMAITALVLAVLGVVTCGITALVGLPLGIAALVRINREPNARGGQGLAIGAIVLSGALALCLPIFGAIILPVIVQARSSAAGASCLSNVKQLSLGVLMYTQDYDEMGPMGRSWTDGLMPYTKSVGLHVCPVQKQVPYGYAMNARISMLPMQAVLSPADCVQLFDAKGSGPNRTGLSALVDWRHARNTASFSFMDGHAKYTPSSYPAPLFEPGQARRF